MYNIFHILLSLNIGGLERGVVNVIKNSHEAFQHNVCCIRSKGPLEIELPASTCVFDLSVKSGTNLSTILRIRYLLKKCGADLVRCYNIEALFHAVPAAMSLGIPILYYNGGRPLHENKKRLIIENILCYFVENIVVPSNDLKTYIINNLKINENKITVIENGVNIETFNHVLYNKYEKRKEIGLNEEEIVLGTVGRLVPEKDYEMMIKSFLRISKEIQMARLIIVGDGPLRNSLENYVKSFGLEKKVLFLGMRTDVPSLYGIMDVFLSSSLSEGFSNVLLEAMASGIPVVATKVNGTDRIIENGVNGFLVNSGDSDEFAYCIIRLLRDTATCKKFSEISYSKILNNYTLSRMVKDYNNLMNHIIKHTN